MDPDKVRIDKWLWSVRLYKTRSAATRACKKHKVKVNGDLVKPSYLLQRSEHVEIHKGGFRLQYKVVDLIEKRVSAPLAVRCYQDLTPESELNKYQQWYAGAQGKEVRPRGMGRPTKRERRVLDEFKDGFEAEE